MYLQYYKESVRLCLPFRTSQKLFSFFNFSLFQPNVMKLYYLYTMLNSTKLKSNLNPVGVAFTVLELGPFTNGKFAEFFVPFLHFSLSRPMKTYTEC